MSVRIVSDTKLDFKDVLIRPKRSRVSSRSQVSLERKYTFPGSGVSWTGVPIIGSNMDHTGTFDMASALARHKLLTAIHKFNSLEDWKDFTKKDPEAIEYTFLTVGIGDEAMKIIQNFGKHLPELKFLCIDVANGYNQEVVSFLKRAREQLPEITIMIGNVVTGEMTEELILCGADIVKIGIGPGSVCTTRRKTGVGYPQLSAILECADAAHGLGGYVAADGGCSEAGDISKSLCAGADFVMLGGMLAGHQECNGKIIKKDGKDYVRFYGMSSEEAMKKYYGGVASYRASEGKSVNIPFRGQVENTLLDILGSIRSTCTYVGAFKVGELSKRATFIRVTAQLNEVYNEFEVKGED